MDESTSTKTMKLVGFIIFMGLLTTVAESYDMSNQSASSFKPVGPTEYRVASDALINVTKTHDVIDEDAQRRRLASPYQLCLLCKCCSTTTCASMPCCFAIDCQLPGKPFGVCAFVPKTCNCVNCTTSG